MVELPGAASGVFVNLSSLLRSSSTKERGDQEQDQGDRKDGEGLLSAQVIKAHSKFRISSRVFQYASLLQGAYIYQIRESSLNLYVYFIFVNS